MNAIERNISVSVVQLVSAPVQQLTVSGHGGTEVGCDNAELGCGDGAALPGEPTDGMADSVSGTECGVRPNVPPELATAVPGVQEPAGGPVAAAIWCLHGVAGVRVFRGKGKWYRWFVIKDGLFGGALRNSHI